MKLLYLLVLLALGIYSYSQIDLNLTLLQTRWFLDFQSSLIQLGYFQRQTSVAVYLTLLSLMALFYIMVIRKPEKVQGKLVILGVAMVVLGLLSYPAFSHDIFNYMFDARIVVYHQANPYVSTALMFPSDTWTRFMNWTHRTYPYGPVFLPLTLPFYILGFNKFVLTLLWFKALMVGAYLGSAYIIYRLAKMKGWVLFALNPLIIIEVVVSGHMDILMLFFGLLAYWFLIRGKTGLSFLLLLLSAGVKYATAFLVPGFFWPKLSGRTRLLFLIMLGYLGAGLQAVTHEVLPHYLIVPLGFTALLPENRYVVWAGVLLSIGLLVARYYPFLLTGQWVPIKIW